MGAFRRPCVSHLQLPNPRPGNLNAPWARTAPPAALFEQRRLAEAMAPEKCGGK